MQQHAEWGIPFAAHGSGLSEQVDDRINRARDALAAPEHVAGPYDVVFMSWGALRWISDFPAFARIVANFLVPGGVFYAVDRHPLAMALDEDWTPASGSPAAMGANLAIRPDPRLDEIVCGVFVVEMRG